MSIKKSFWKVATVIVVCLIILNPEAIALGMFIDAMGLDILVLLVEVQLVAVAGYYFQNWVKPVLCLLY